MKYARIIAVLAACTSGASLASAIPILPPTDGTTVSFRTPSTRLVRRSPPDQTRPRKSGLSNWFGFGGRSSSTSEQNGNSPSTSTANRTWREGLSANWINDSPDGATGPGSHSGSPRPPLSHTSIAASHPTIPQHPPPAYSVHDESYPVPEASGSRCNLQEEIIDPDDGVNVLLYLRTHPLNSESGEDAQVYAKRVLGPYFKCFPQVQKHGSNDDIVRAFVDSEPPAPGEKADNYVVRLVKMYLESLEAVAEPIQHGPPQARVASALRVYEQSSIEDVEQLDKRLKSKKLHSPTAIDDAVSLFFGEDLRVRLTLPHEMTQDYGIWLIGTYFSRKLGIPKGVCSHISNPETIKSFMKDEPLLRGIRDAKEYAESLIRVFEQEIMVNFACKGETAEQDGDSGLGNNKVELLFLRKQLFGAETETDLQYGIRILRTFFSRRPAVYNIFLPSVFKESVLRDFVSSNTRSSHQSPAEYAKMLSEKYAMKIEESRHLTFSNAGPRTLHASPP